jgi:hypothetical protein
LNEFDEVCPRFYMLGYVNGNIIFNLQKTNKQLA